MVSPTLPVRLTLNLSIPSTDRLRSTLLERLNDLLHGLGVPGSVELEIATATAGRPDPLPLTLEVNHRSCDYSPEMARQLYRYTNRAVFDPPGEVSDHLRAWASQAGNEDRQKQVTELISLICVEAIKLQPSVLLGPDQLTAYQAELNAWSSESSIADRKPAPGRPPALEWLEPVLSFALDHKLSIASSAILPASRTVADLLLDCRRQEMTDIYAAEELMDELVPRDTRVGIHFAPGYLREVTETHDEDVGESFFGLRQTIYDEFGVSLPWFKFVENPDLEPQSFALGINAHVLTPWARPGRLNTQSQLEGIVYALGQDLRASLDCLFPRWYTDEYISGIEQSFPTLVKMVKDRFNQTQRARVLRKLLADKVSLRNLRGILERMLDYEGDPDDLEKLDNFVRAGITLPAGGATR